MLRTVILVAIWCSFAITTGADSKKTRIKCLYDYCKQFGRLTFQQLGDFFPLCSAGGFYSCNLLTFWVNLHFPPFPSMQFFGVIIFFSVSVFDQKDVIFVYFL